MIGPNLPAELWASTEIFPEGCRTGMGRWTTSARFHVLQ